jgi:hypothetical protein
MNMNKHDKQEFKVFAGLLLTGLTLGFVFSPREKVAPVPVENPTVVVTTQKPKVEIPEVQTNKVSENRDKDVVEMEQYLRSHGEAKGEYYRGKYGW